MRTLIISDLHLHASRPELTSLAFSLFDKVAVECDQLYILGDLFEYWLGDDACDNTASEVATHLKAITSQNVSISVMHGNRDFLLGEHYVKSFGGHLIRDDSITLDLAGKETLFMHGDTLCTDDSQYQFYRRMVRNTGWQADFLAKSVSERESTARMIRSTSKAHGHRAHQEKIADISSSTLDTTVTEMQTTRIVHGHTHRPALHQHTINGQSIERMVLGDWHNDHAVVAVADDSDNQCRLMTWNGSELHLFSQ